MIKETLKKLRDVRAEGCVSILLPTHRTHPDNKRDFILLRNMLHEAKERLLQDYDKRQVPETLANLEDLAERIDPRYNLDGLAIYLNEDICEYVRLPMPVEPRVILDKTFATRDLLRALNQIENYYILTIIGHLPGNWDEETLVNLARESWKLVQYYIDKEGEKAMEHIGQAISQNRLITSLGDIWAAIQKGKGETLYVEKGYFQPAILENGLVITVDHADQPDVVPDLVDEMIEALLSFGGNVSFLEDGALDEFGRIALKVRY
ncbi:MAG: hypothetical protein IPJ40_18605 [Saprospirales bacterium]|nr:hypothetical protein [Saprospirales bacterium]